MRNNNVKLFVSLIIINLAIYLSSAHYVDFSKVDVNQYSHSMYDLGESSNRSENSNNRISKSGLEKMYENYMEAKSLFRNPGKRNSVWNTLPGTDIPIAEILCDKIADIPGFRSVFGNKAANYELTMENVTSGSKSYPLRKMAKCAYTYYGRPIFLRIVNGFKYMYFLGYPEKGNIRLMGFIDYDHEGDRKLNWFLAE